MDIQTGIRRSRKGFRGKKVSLDSFTSKKEMPCSVHFGRKGTHFFKLLAPFHATRYCGHFKEIPLRFEKSHSLSKENDSVTLTSLPGLRRTNSQTSRLGLHTVSKERHAIRSHDVLWVLINSVLSKNSRHNSCMTKHDDYAPIALTYYCACTLKG